MDGSYISIANLGDLLPSSLPQEGRRGRASATPTPNRQRSRSPATPSKRSSSSSALRSNSSISGMKSFSSSGMASSSRPTSRASSRRSSIEHILHDDSPQRQAIREAVIKRDAEELRKLSIKGFIHDAMRRLVWPLLLNATAPMIPPIREEDVLRRRKQLEESREKGFHGEDEKGTDNAERHRDEFQVELDVNRSFVHLPIDDQRDNLRKQLSELIVSTLRRYPALNYFQGYHDIISIVLIISEDDMDLAHRMTAKLSLFHIRDSMMTGLDPAIGYLRLLKRILAKADPVLSAAVEQASTLPYFSLSWVLTLMAHDLTSIDLVSRIYDFLLAHNPAMVSYLSAAIVMAKKEELDHLDPDLADDPATLHTVLSKLPPLTTDPPGASSHATSVRSLPSSPKPGYTHKVASDGFSTSHSLSTASLASLGDPDVDVPAFRHSFPNGGSRTRYNKRPTPIPIETLFHTATQLYEAFPLDHAGIDANTIFGPKSAVFTWANRNLSEQDAEQIVLEGTDVIIAEVVDSEKDDIAKLPINDKLARRRRQLQVRYLLRNVFIIHRQATIFTLVGVTGLLLALYARDGPFLQLGSKSWIRNNWLFKWTLARL